MSNSEWVLLLSVLDEMRGFTLLCRRSACTRLTYSNFFVQPGFFPVGNQRRKKPSLRDRGKHSVCQAANKAIEQKELMTNIGMNTGWQD